MLNFLNSLKTSENRRFSDIFRGYRSETLVEDGLNNEPRFKWILDHPMNLTIDLIKPFLAKIPIWYPLKTSGNLWFSVVFRAHKNGNIGQKWVKPSKLIIIATTERGIHFENF